MLAFLCLVSFLISGVFPQNDTTVGTPVTVSDDTDKAPLADSEVVLNSEGGFGGFSTTPQKNKHFNVNFLDKLSPTNWLLRPLADKFSKFNDFLHSGKPHNDNPNYGGVNSWSPQFLLDKLHENGPQLLTGPYNSIYGFTHFTQHHNKKEKDLDFPFAYRKN